MRLAQKTVHVKMLVIAGGLSIAVGSNPARALQPMPSTAQPDASRLDVSAYAYGEIVRVDLRNGRLLLSEHAGPMAGGQAEYIITPHDTTVTDSLDQQFLQIEDLKPGQFVQVEFIPEPRRRMAKTVMVESNAAESTVAIEPRPWDQTVTGEVVSIDLQQREFVVRERVPGGAAPERTYRMIAPQGVAFTEARTGAPIFLEDLRVGQEVRIDVSRRVPAAP